MEYKKERLFEMFQKVNKIKLNEEVLSSEEKEILLKEFIVFAADKLKLKNLPKINLIMQQGAAQKMQTFGNYDFADKELDVVCYNRNFADILRSLGHELVHHKQNIKCGLNHESGKTGSDEENQANEMAGILLREFGKKHTDIFE